MSLIEPLAGAAWTRRLADRVWRRYARQRVDHLDTLDLRRSQERTLLRLLHRARDTRFGSEYGFGSIGSVAEYQRRVPLRTYEDFWKGYWEPAFPLVRGVTGPDAVPYFALSSGTTSGTTKYVPITSAMLKSNQRAALTTLAFYQAAHPTTALFSGRIFFLGGSTQLQNLGMPPKASAVRAGDLSGIAAVEVSSFLRPYTFPPTDLGLLGDWDRKVQLLAERSASLPITVLTGVPSWLLVLFDRLKQVTGRDRIADIWPTLRLVVHGGTKFDPYRALFRQELGAGVQLLETYPCSEGFVATEDPQYELLRLVPDHGIFFEFVPVDELGQERPMRHTVANLEPGVQYAVALTTCAGLWSYLVGDTVCFERRDPPLLRFTGRTKYFLSAFGEHLISEEVERAVAATAEQTGATVTDFHVGPIFPTTPRAPGHHLYLLEFATAPRDLEQFAVTLDAALGRLNEDYAAHRKGDLSMARPEVVAVRRGGFADWMRSCGKLGGQHKVPRMDNSGQLTLEISRWLAAAGQD